MTRTFLIISKAWAWISPATRRAHIERRLALTLRNYVKNEPEAPTAEAA